MIAMFKFQTKLLITIFMCLLLVSSASAEFFSDVIVTSPDGIWTDSRSYVSLQAAINSVGANDREIVIVNPQSVTNLTVPSNVRLKFLRNGSINNSGQLTINTRNITADDRQIFTGVGDIDFVNGSVVRSSWFSDVVDAFNVTSDDSLTMIISEPGHVTSNATVGNEVSLKWEAIDNHLIVYGGKILSNVKNITADNYQIFAGAGDIDFLDGSELYLSWFRRLRSVLTWVENERVTIIVNEDSLVEYTQASTFNECIKFVSGGVLNISAAVTLTLNGLVEAGSCQIFTGAGTLTYNSPTTPRLTWFSDLSSAVASIGMFETVLIIDTDDIMTGNIAVPITLALEFIKGNTIVTTGHTLTINGSFSAGLYQTFSGVGTVTFGPGAVVATYPEWWDEDAGDGTTDCTLAVNAAIAAHGSNYGTVQFVTGVYVVSSIDATMQRGLILRGSGTHANATQIIGKTADKNVIDLTGSVDCKIEDFLVSGDSTNIPKVGILLARDIGGGSCDKHFFSDIRMNGKFSVAAIYNFASEKPTFINNVIINEANNACCYKASQDNPDSIASDYATILSGSQSGTNHNFFNSTFWYYGTSGYAMWFDDGENINFFGGAITCPGITNDISVFIKDVNLINFIGTRFEAFANTTHFRFEGNVGHVDITNCHISHATNCMDAVVGAVLSQFNIRSQLLVPGNKIDLSNALLKDSYIYYGTKELEIGANSVDCVFEGINANFTDAAGTVRIFVKDNSTLYTYGGATPTLYNAEDPIIICLVKHKGTLNSEYASFQDNNGVERHKFAATGYTEINTSDNLTREALQIIQNDQDRAFINFDGTSEAGVTKNITTWKTGAILAGYIRVEVEGTNQWMPYYSAPTGP